MMKYTKNKFIKIILLLLCSSLANAGDMRSETKNKKISFLSGLAIGAGTASVVGGLYKYNKPFRTKIDDYVLKSVRPIYLKTKTKIKENQEIIRRVSSASGFSFIAFGLYKLFTLLGQEKNNNNIDKAKTMNLSIDDSAILGGELKPIILSEDQDASTGEHGLDEFKAGHDSIDELPEDYIIPKVLTDSRFFDLSDSKRPVALTYYDEEEDEGYGSNDNPLEKSVVFSSTVQSVTNESQELLIPSTNFNLYPQGHQGSEFTVDQHFIDSSFSRKLENLDKKKKRKGISRADVLARNNDLISNILFGGNLPTDISDELFEASSAILRADYSVAEEGGYINLKVGLLKEINEIKKLYLDPVLKNDKVKWTSKILIQDVAPEHTDSFNEGVCKVIKQYYRALQKYGQKGLAKF